MDYRDAVITYVDVLGFKEIIEQYDAGAVDAVLSQFAKHAARRVEEIVRSIRRDRSALVVHRSHGIAARCAGCAMRGHCDERLA